MILRFAFAQSRVFLYRLPLVRIARYISETERDLVDNVRFEVWVLIPKRLQHFIEVAGGSLKTKAFCSISWFNVKI